MLKISRKLIRTLRSVFRKVGASADRLKTAFVAFRSEGDSVRIQCRCDDFAAEYQLAEAQPHEAFRLPLAAFADCEGGKEVPVHVRLEGNDVVVAEWVDGGVPQVRRYSVTQDDANWFERPCSMRLLKENPIPYVVLSQGITGSGIELFRQTTAQSLEGVVAKRLNSRYLPGRRTDAWVKIKNGIELFCCIIGYEPSGTDDFGKLILAHEVNGKLCGVGSVGTGFDAAMRQRLNAFLWTHRRSTPVVKCGRRGIWVEPQLVCRVTCMELTRGGEMRTSVFHELVKE